MVSTTEFREFNNSSTSYTTATNLNLVSANVANATASLYPIVAGTYSYEKIFKLHFAGTFTTISSIKMYKSSGSNVTGEIINYTGQLTTWATPTNSASSNAITSIPTSEPTTANVSIGGSLSGELTEEGDTDFIVLQGDYSTNTSAGAVQQKTLSFTWIES